MRCQIAPRRPSPPRATRAAERSPNAEDGHGTRAEERIGRTGFESACRAFRWLWRRAEWVRFSGWPSGAQHAAREGRARGQHLRGYQRVRGHAGQRAEHGRRSGGDRGHSWSVVAAGRDVPHQRHERAHELARDLVELDSIDERPLCLGTSPRLGAAARERLRRGGRHAEDELRSTGAEPENRAAVRWLAQARLASAGAVGR